MNTFCRSWEHTLHILSISPIMSAFVLKHSRTDSAPTCNVRLESYLGVAFRLLLLAVLFGPTSAPISAI